MTGFEVIVRPEILPDIRPARQPRMPAPTAAADQNMAVLSGGSAQMIDLTTSTSYSSSKTKQVEKKRKFNKERIYHKDDDGTIDKSQYIDVERIKKIEYMSGDPSQTVYAEPPQRDNVEILEKDQIRNNTAAGA
jgi:homoaconitase/3-isopropylmalate dehydratase large subunit